jgi:sugar-specific transcriptional regulator TrmB
MYISRAKQEGKNLTPLEEDIKILEKIGLTFLEAKTYLTLLQSKAQTAKEISKAAQIDRSVTYRVLLALQKKGLVEKLITTPTKVKPTPLSNGIRILRERRRKENENVEAKVKELLSRSKEYDAGSKLSYETQYVLISETRADVRRFKEKVGNAQESISGVMNWAVFKGAIVRDSEFFAKFANRGIRFRYLTKKPETEKAPKIFNLLQKTGYFEVRYLSKTPQAEFAIIDNNEMAIIDRTASKDVGVLWTTNPCLISTFRKFFESLWLNSKP